MIHIKRFFAMLLAFSALVSMASCGNVNPKPQEDTDNGAVEEIEKPAEENKVTDYWVASWGTAMQKGEEDARKPTAMALNGNTLRQQVRVSVGGEKIRLTFSNQYGETPVTLSSVHIAKLISYGKSEIDISTDTVITFNGAESVIIPAGGAVTSDEIDFITEELDCLAVTVMFGEDALPPIYTCHTLSKCTSWLSEGDGVSLQELTTKNDKSCSYFLQSIDVLSIIEAGAVICLGDSITDGQGSGGDALGSYPDQLAALLQEDLDTTDLSVINMGIAGNKIFKGAGDPCKDRIVRDVTEITGAEYCVIMIGINDIAGAKEDISETLIEEIKKMISVCRESGIKVIGATLTPFKDSKHYSELHEQMRKTLNAFIASPDSGFDAYVDTSAAVADENDPEKLKKEYSSGDWLHLNKTGYEAIAEAVFEVVRQLETK